MFIMLHICPQLQIQLGFLVKICASAAFNKIETKVLFVVILAFCWKIRHVQSEKMK